MLPDRRQRWLPDTFHMLVRNAELFEQAVEEVNTKAETVNVETDNGQEIMVLIASDNEQIARAASSVKTGKSAITVISNSAGRTAILADHTRGIDLSNLATMIRMAEHRVFTGKKLAQADAVGLGVVEKCRHWHLANPNLLLNGSHSHPLVMPSKLTLDEIKDIASRAFMKTQRDAWFLNYHEGRAKVVLPQDDSVKLVLS